jgi:hypothetical protein
MFIIHPTLAYLPKRIREQVDVKICEYKTNLNIFNLSPLHGATQRSLLVQRASALHWTTRKVRGAQTIHSEPVGHNRSVGFISAFCLASVIS